MTDKGVSTWNAIYLQGELPPKAAGLFEDRVPVRRVGHWTELELPAVRLAAWAARALSARVEGEVVWILIQTDASVLVVVHHARGEETRSLVYANGLWRHVQGEPRPWEAALFSAEELEEALASGEDETAVREAFADQTLLVDEMYPWPREYPAMWSALGLDEAEWQRARSTSVDDVIVGSRFNRQKLIIRLMIAADALLILIAIVFDGDARVICAVIGAVLFVLIAMTVTMARVAPGRWLF